MIIKKWNKFIEAISGWELVGKHMGPDYPEQVLHNTLSQSDTEMIEGVDGVIYTYDDYQNLYQDYLKTGGSPITDGFTKSNLDSIISYLGF
jgi:hypothetical protein